MAKQRIPEHLRQRVFKRDHYTCRYCGKTGIPLEADHVYPESKGGETTIDNLASACRRCNVKKYNHVGLWPMPIGYFEDIEKLKQSKIKMVEVVKLKPVTIVPEFSIKPIIICGVFAAVAQFLVGGGHQGMIIVDPLFDRFVMIISMFAALYFGGVYFGERGMWKRTLEAQNHQNVKKVGFSWLKRHFRAEQAKSLGK